MNSLCIKDNPECIKETLAIIGDKYSALLIRVLNEGPKRFKDFEASVPGISPRTLSMRLAMLEEKGIVSKDMCPDSPGRCQYDLTDSGKELDSVVHAMAEWGTKYMATNEELACLNATQKHIPHPLVRKN